MRLDAIQTKLALVLQMNCFQREVDKGIGVVSACYTLIASSAAKAKG